MPHRTLLSPEQRTRVLGIPTEAAEMAKHYVLSTGTWHSCGPSAV